MKKLLSISVTTLVITLGVLPTAALADYPSCRHNGGGFWDCAWQAALNDRIAPPRGDDDNNAVAATYSEAEFNGVFTKEVTHCQKMPVAAQTSCISSAIKVSEKRLKIVHLEMGKLNKHKAVMKKPALRNIAGSKQIMSLPATKEFRRTDFKK